MPLAGAKCKTKRRLSWRKADAKLDNRAEGGKGRFMVSLEKEKKASVQIMKIAFYIFVIISATT
jgi:hypothetical protein